MHCVQLQLGAGLATGEQHTQEPWALCPLSYTATVHLTDDGEGA